MTEQLDHDPDQTSWGLVAAKRAWVPEWLWTLCTKVVFFDSVAVMRGEKVEGPVQLLNYQPFRWMFTTTAGVPASN